MSQNLENIFRGKTVLITGHTGFKGSWLSIWLNEMGANVIGYSLSPPTSPSLFDLAGIKNTITHFNNDIRDYHKLAAVVDAYHPQIIFHLAAQSLVLSSYDQPKDTFDINAGGTVNLLEACREKDFIQAIVIITTDKCYDNKEWLWGYRENDALGGHDPYSASKAMAEIAVAAYRKSFFHGNIPVATARAGNVIGGGDFSDFRIIPDTMKSLLNNTPAIIRNCNSIRPWIHVLDPLYGYLLLVEKLVSNGQAYADAWNFGPKENHPITVKMLVEKAIACWGYGDWVDTGGKNQKKEMHNLRLNWEKAANHLGWHPAYNWEEAIKETVEWFRAFKKNPDQHCMYSLCKEQIHNYLNKRKSPKVIGREIYPNASEGIVFNRS